MEHEGHRIHQHRRGYIPYPPLQSAAEEISERRARERKHPAYPWAGACDHRHAEGRAVPKHTRAGHHSAEEHIYPAARRDKKAHVRSAARSLQGRKPALTPNIHNSLPPEFT